MLHRIYINILDTQGNDLPNHFIDVDIPHQLTIGERIIVNSDGWELAVKTAIYDIIYHRWAIELASVQLLMEDSTVDDLLHCGWKSTEILGDEPIPANPAAWSGPYRSRELP